MKSSARTAAALGAGYLLGRRRRFRTALLAAGATAVGSTPIGGQLLRHGVRLAGRGTKLAASSGVLGKVSPELSDIASVIQKDLLTAGKAAAGAAVSSRVNALADSIHDRAELVRNPEALAGEAGEQVSRQAGETRDRATEAGNRAGETGGRAVRRTGKTAGKVAGKATGNDEAESGNDEADGEADTGDIVTVRRTGAGKRSPVTRTRTSRGQDSEEDSGEAEAPAEDTRSRSRSRASGSRTAGSRSAASRGAAKTRR